MQVIGLLLDDIVRHWNSNGRVMAAGVAVTIGCPPQYQA